MDVGTQIGPYLIVGRLGKGGMGEVFRARDTVLDREVAIKTLPPEMRDNQARLSRFEREARLLASLNHPNIAILHGIEQKGDERCLVMELVEGVPLDRLLERGPLSPPEAVRIGRQIAEALEAAHEKGIVHRDLKPSNVVVGPKGRVKVLDFGGAKALEPVATLMPGQQEGLTQVDLTATGAVLGTPPYMSPEQVRGRQVDERADIWAFGCLLYELLTAKRLFQRESWADTVTAILSAEPDWRALPADLSPGLCALLARCLTKDCERRLPKIAEARVELERLYDDRSGTWAPSLSVPELPTVVDIPRSTPPAGRRRLVLAAAGVLALALAVVAVLAWPRARGLWGGSRPANGLGEITSLVVLPSQVLGSTTDLFLADAIPNTVSTQLAQIEGLETKAPPTNVEFDRIGRDLERIAQVYRVGAVVVPTVKVAGDRLILNLQLITVPGRAVRWTQEFEDRRDRYIELARAAADGVRRALRPTAPELPKAADVVRSSEAELALHQGIFLAELFRRQGLQADFTRARSALERAAQLDPRQAEAPVELARLHAARIVTGVAPQEIVPEVRRWAERALAIDPRSSGAWAVLSEADQIDPAASYRSLLENALKAAAFGPEDGYAQGRLGYALSRRSPLLALEASNRARALDPLNLTPPLQEALTLAPLGHVDEARARVAEARKIDPDMPFGILVDSLVEVVGANGQRAAELAEDLAPMARDGRIRPEWLDLVRDYATFEKAAREGDREVTEQAAARLLAAARGQARFPRWDSATSQVAPLLTRHGRAREALELLVYRQRLGVPANYEFYLLSKDLEPLRADPRYEQLVVEGRKEFDDLLSILAAARRRGDYPSYLDAALDQLLSSLGVERPW